MDLSCRMKKYEKVFSYSAVSRMPLIVRVDGKAFHTFTKGLEAYDQGIIDAMVKAAIYVASNMQGFKAGYVQSDEATFCLTDYDHLNTEGWFGYKLSKIVSVSAAMMSVAFNKFYLTDKMPVFDSRAFTVPIDEVCNVLLWRAKDWERNSLEMYSRTFFSTKQLFRKRRADMHQMLHEIGKNWTTDLDERKRNGTFLLSTAEGIVERSDILPNYNDIEKATGHYWLPTNGDNQ